MLLGPKVLLDEAENLFAVRGSRRCVMVTVETGGTKTGIYGLFGAVALEVSGVGDAGDSMVGEAGDSKVGEAGESIIGEAGDSTIVSAAESILKWDEGSNRLDAGESMSGESGGARSGESSPADFLQDGSCLSLDTDSLDFFFAGSSSSIGCIWPLGRNDKLLLKI